MSRFPDQRHSLCSRCSKIFLPLISLLFNLFFFQSDYNFIIGYLILLGALHQIFVPCLIGTVLECKCEQFYNGIYSISWVKLPVSDQKMLLMILGSAGKMQSISFLFMKLNLNTFIKVRNDGKRAFKHSVTP